MANRYVMKLDKDGNKVGQFENDGWAGEGVPPHYVLKDVNGNVIGSWTAKDNVEAAQILNKVDEKIAEYKKSTATASGVETADEKTARLAREAAARDEAKRLEDAAKGATRLTGLEKELQALMEQNKNYYGSQSRALRLGEGETSAKMFGGKYDVDLNQDGEIQDNERGYGNTAGNESIMGRAASSVNDRLAQSGISDFNTLGENRNARTQKDLTGALSSLMNQNTQSLASLQNSQWGAENAAKGNINDALLGLGTSTGADYYNDNGEWKIKPPKPGEGYEWNEDGGQWDAPDAPDVPAIPNATPQTIPGSPNSTGNNTGTNNTAVNPNAGQSWTDPNVKPADWTHPSGRRVTYRWNGERWVQTTA